METITIRVQVTAPDAPTAEIEAIRAACEAGPHESASRAVERVLFDRSLAAAVRDRMARSAAVLAEIKRAFCARDGESALEAAQRYAEDLRHTNIVSAGDRCTLKWAARALEFVNENFQGDFHAGEDPARVIIRLLEELRQHRAASR